MARQQQKICFKNLKSISKIPSKIIHMKNYGKMFIHILQTLIFLASKLMIYLLTQLILKKEIKIIIVYGRWIWAPRRINFDLMPLISQKN